MNGDRSFSLTKASVIISCNTYTAHIQIVVKIFVMAQNELSDDLILKMTNTV